MTQRLKPVDMKNSQEYSNYLEKLNLCHMILVYAMKAKQTTDLSHVEKLRNLVESFRKAYFGQKKEMHEH